jgi:ribosomal protein L7/L12
VPFAGANATGMPTAVVELARAGNLIAAIKEYRQITGAGLAEAKKAVEDVR